MFIKELILNLSFIHLLEDTSNLFWFNKWLPYQVEKISKSYHFHRNQ